jgi:hypothetical protein
VAVRFRDVLLGVFTSYPAVSTILIALIAGGLWPVGVLPLPCVGEWWFIFAVYCWLVP